MEAMDIILAATRDLSYSIINHPFYSVLGCIGVSILLLRFYCRLTLGICECEDDMEGMTVLITGGSAGIGKATAKNLAERNARVILACRNMDKARKVANEIIVSTGNKNVVVKQLDLSSFSSVRKCAEDLLKTEEKLHVLINNAGMFADKQDFVTEDGCEKVFQSNHLGHFLLTLLLLDLLKKGAPSRIINVSSSSYANGKLDMNDLKAEKMKGALDLYSRSKLANILFTKELALRLANTGITVNALNPGLVKTDIMQQGGLFAYLVTIMMFIIGKSCEEGAQTTIYLAVHPEVQATSGKYFADCKEEPLTGKALHKTLPKQLFIESERIVGATFKKP